MMSLVNSVLGSILMLDSKLNKRSSKDDDDCDDDSLGSCQKPVNDDSLTIGLAIGIPVFVILCVLSFFLFRNYRKGKKESMEHDPDFDETGEATMLPDFPNQKQYMEDPFHNRNSVRYPGLNHAAKESTTSLTQTVQADPYLDNFVLPYHHQTGSKVSLNEYARQLGEHQPYGNTPRASTYFNRTRNSSFSNVNGSIGGEHSISPQKSKLKPEASNQRDKSPLRSMGKPTSNDYTNLPNESVAEFQDPQDDTVEDNTSDLESASNSESSAVSGTGGEKFAVNYENESELALNEPINPQNHSKFIPTGHARQSFDSTSEETDVYTAKSGESDSALDRDIDNRDDTIDATVDETVDGTTVEDNLNETNEETDIVSNDEPKSVEEAVSREAVQSPFEDDNAKELSMNDNERNNLDTDVSQETTSPELDELRNSTNTTATTVGNLDLPTGPPGRSKSPRISAFNLLKNDSDDENEIDDQEKFLSPEEEEELRRMKSVYKVYFDREKSQNSKFGDARTHEFTPDPDYPLGDLPHKIDYLRINKDLKTDTNYDKRLTTTSSIYSETPIFSSEEQQFYHNQQEFVNNPNIIYQAPPQQYQPPPPDLPPLQQLPPPSDIRKSTIQTYTDYRPRTKNQAVPNGKQPFVPIENDQVWTSPIASPSMQSQSSFGQSQQSLSTMTSNLTTAHTVPSATQLSRSSVVMLNPVTEITKQRKFRPAGSLPSHTQATSLTNRSIQNQQFLNANNGINNSESELIPGNRKSAVRRMMNTNF